LTITYEIWLYGSRARGDADSSSDTDLLFIGHESDTVASSSEALGFAEASTTFYTWQEVQAMWGYGSLFLQHIRDEGRILSPWTPEPQRFRGLLTTLPPFARAQCDLRTFRRALIEAETSLSDGGWPDVELSILATVARHAAILACHCIGKPRFGRIAPFSTWAAHAGWTERDSGLLIRGSLAFRFTAPGAPEWLALERGARTWLDLLHRFLNEMEDDVVQYEQSLLAPS
jgi:hypothetical protein